MIVDNVLRNKIHDELIENNIGIKSIVAIDGDNPIGAKIEFKKGVDMSLVQTIIDNHKPTPLPTPVSELDKVKIAQAEQFEYILQAMEGMM